MSERDLFLQPPMPTYRCAKGHEYDSSGLGMDLDGKYVLICPECFTRFAIEQGWEMVEVK